MRKKELKELIKKDLIAKSDTSLKFDLSLLSSNVNEYPYRKRKNRIFNLIYGISIPAVSILTCLIVSIGIVPKKINNTIDIVVDEQNVPFDYVPRSFAKKYEDKSVSYVTSSTYLQLNTIDSVSSTEYLKISQEYANSVQEFSAKVLKNIVSNEGYNKVSNICYSPLSLYSSLNLISSASTDTTIINEIDNVLGLNEETRTENYNIVYNRDNYYNEYSGVYGKLKLNNGLFISPRYSLKESIKEKLSDSFTQIYQADFASSTDKTNIVRWYNGSTSDNQYITSCEDLGITDSTSVSLLSTFDFDAGWFNPYFTENINTNIFKVGRESYQIDFMRHLAYNCHIHDYDTYYSVSDSLTSGLTVKYFLPKYSDDNIFEILDEVGYKIFGEDDCSRLLYIQSDSIVKKIPKVLLNVPMFNNSTTYDFTDIISNMGASSLFEGNTLVNSMAVIESNNNLNVGRMKQSCSVGFNIDGKKFDADEIINATKFKIDYPYCNMIDQNGVTYVTINDIETVILNLNIPFVYVIYDNNQLPLYVGTYRGPNN